MKEIQIIKTRRFFFIEKQKTVFVLSEEGLYYNSKLGDIGLIPWKDIISMEVDSFKRLKIIRISIENFRNYKKKMSRLKQALAQEYKKMMKSEVVIFHHDIDIELDELFHLLNDFWSSAHK